MVLMLAQPVSAKTLTGSITDPVGDANRWINKNMPIPDYLDIVGATVTLDTKAGVFTMTMEVAGKIPDIPLLFNGIQTMMWEWAFDIEGGPYPISPWYGTMEEYVVIVTWDGDAWAAELWDFTVVKEPGGPILIHDLLLTIGKTGFTVSVESALMNDIRAFLWASADLGLEGPDPTNFASYAWWYFDVAGGESGWQGWSPWPE